MAYLNGNGLGKPGIYSIYVVMNKVATFPIKTEIFHPGNDLNSFLTQHLQRVPLEGNVLAVTSKIISLSEKQLVPKDSVAKLDLIKKEADRYLGPGGWGSELTVKHGILIPSAGIDESNSESDHYILYPDNPYQSAKKIWEHLRKEFKLKNFGIILTDSHTMPLRRGVTGISLAHWGIKATRSLIDHPDIFGRLLKFTHVDVVDALANMAVFVMGEADDRCPLAIIEGAKVEFTTESSPAEIAIEPELDLYQTFFKKK